MLRAVTRMLLALVAVVAALELTMRVLPVSTATLTGYHLDPDLLTYPARHSWRVSTGWDLRNPQRLQSNSAGFAADREFLPDPNAVALIGDSFVEASMLDVGDRPGAALQRMLPERPVYALGGPGSALLDYAQRIRWSREQLQVRDFVLLLEAQDARQSLCGSGNVHSRCLDPITLAPRIERQLPPGLAKRVLRHSALAQYLAGQIRVNPASLTRTLFSRTTPETATLARRSSPPPTEGDLVAMRKRVDAVVVQFFEAARPHLTGRLLMLIDGSRDGAPRQPALVDLERGHLISRLREGGAEVIDLELVYARHASASPRALQVGPYDAHLNALGVRLAMGQAAAALAP